MANQHQAAAAAPRPKRDREPEPEDLSPMARPFYVSDQVKDFFKGANLGYGGADIATKLQEGFDITKDPAPGHGNRPEEQLGLFFGSNVANAALLNSVMSLYIKVNGLQDMHRPAFMRIDDRMRQFFGDGTNSRLSLNGSDRTDDARGADGHISGLGLVERSIYDFNNPRRAEEIQFYEKGAISMTRLVLLWSRFRIRSERLKTYEADYLEQPDVRDVVRECLIYIMGAVEKRDDGRPLRQSFEEKKVKGLLDYQRKYLEPVQKEREANFRQRAREKRLEAQQHLAALQAQAAAHLPPAAAAGLALDGAARQQAWRNRLEAEEAARERFLAEGAANALAPDNVERIRERERLEGLAQARHAASLEDAFKAGYNLGRSHNQ